MFAQEQGGKANTTTVDSSTVDAGVPGTGKQVGIASVAASATGAGNSTVINVNGSIILQQPSATVQTGGTASVTCTYDDLQALGSDVLGPLGTVAVPGAGPSGTSDARPPRFARLLRDQLPAAGGGDGRRPGAGAGGHATPRLPSPQRAPTTCGNPCVVDGNRRLHRRARPRRAPSCKGSGYRASAVAVERARAAARRGQGRAEPTASVPNVPSAALTWTFSDGATGTGASVTHAFAATGDSKRNGHGDSEPRHLRSQRERERRRRRGARAGTPAPASRILHTQQTQRHEGDLHRHAGVDDRLHRCACGDHVACSAGRCHVPTAKNVKGKGCTLEVALGHFNHHDVAGANHLTFRGMLKRKPLPPGTYTLEAVASNANGTGKAIRLTFKVTG